jgi:parvulin-like peptidyl-prolyl isomerase
MRGLLRMLPLAVLAAALVACGSSSSNKLAKDDVAVVGDTHITQSQLDHEIAIVIANLKANKRQVPTAGSTAYKSQVIDQSVQQLVFQAEVRGIAKQLNVTVPDARVKAAITTFIKKSYGGDVSKYQAALKKFGLTAQDVFDNVQLSELEKAIGTKLAAESPVNDKTALAYYNAHKASFKVTDDTRQVNYILVDSKSTAQKDLQQLNAGKSQAQVAAGAIDSNTAHQPVTPFTVTRSSGDEKDFVAAAMSLPTRAWSQPVVVSKSYAKQSLPGKCKPDCYFLIYPVSDLLKKGTQQTFAQVKAQILSQLKSTTQAQHVQQREQQLLNDQKKKVSYAAAYAPPSASTTPATTSSTTT